ncbi:MAG TPA: PAS domain S-box protein, partial [Terriglobales bacterium]|nr:PAS domain S-box protein [Terriglobales bacterium]
AKYLKEALRRGAPPVLSTTQDSLIPEWAPAWDDDDPVVQKAYLDQLVECAPEAITILDTSHRVMRINSEFTRMFGFSTEEVLGKTLAELIVPTERTAESDWIQEAVEKGQKVALETRRQRRDGTLLEVSVSCVPVLVGEKQVGICALYRDIEEHKRAQLLSSALYRIAERTGSASHLQGFYASIHNIVGELMNARNFYIALYDSATQLLSFPHFVDEQDPTPASRRLGQGLTEYVLRTGEPLLATPEVFEDLRAQGEVDLIGSPSLDWMGVPLRAGNQTFGVLVVQSYHEDVRFGERDKEILTFVSQQLASAIDHNRHEEALRRSEARYRSLVQSAVYGIYRASIDGNFLDVNPALIHMLGYESPDELVKLDPQRDVFVEPKAHCHLMQEFQRTGKLDSAEVRWKRKDGSAITVRLSGRSAAAIDECDAALEVIAEDVTERRALEDQFRQAQKMEAVGRLAGGVAHDFNNLLMVVSGYTEVVLEQLDENDPMLPKLQAIQQAADRATTLTRQLLAFSRKQLLELKVVDVNAIVADMERLLRPLIGENIDLTTRLTPNVGHTRADAGQLEQVIMNLVVNAKDAMPGGGRIIIETTEEELDAVHREHSLIQPGSYILLSVSDTGAGMDKETQSRIFEPFFTTKEKSKGTGLGLSTVYGIVKQSGGYIFAHSELGSGTTFRIYLPKVADPSGQPGIAKHPQVPSGGSETVLLVEDEDSVRELVRETLQSKGYTVMEAPDGISGMKVAESHDGKIDILITDVVMPGMSGRELAQRVSAARPDIKVLYLSGYTEDAIIHEGVLDPGTAFLQKPFTLQALARKVRDVLHGEVE